MLENEVQLHQYRGHLVSSAFSSLFSLGWNPIILNASTLIASTKKPKWCSLNLFEESDSPKLHSALEEQRCSERLLILLLINTVNYTILLGIETPSLKPRKQKRTAKETILSQRLVCNINILSEWIRTKIRSFKEYKGTASRLPQKRSQSLIIWFYLKVHMKIISTSLHDTYI